MTYKLYNRLGSGGFAVEAALALTGTDFELILIDSVPGSELPESFRATNPWRQVPVMITPDGARMTESAAMLIYIAQLYPAENVAPEPGTPEMAALLRWIVFLSSNVYEGTLRRIYPARFTSNENDAAGVREAAVRRNDEAFAMLERELQSRRFLCGEKMTLADVYLAMMFAWHPGNERYGACTALTHKVAGHSVIAPRWQKNFDHRLKVKWGRSQE